MDDVERISGPVMGAPDDTPQTWAYIDCIRKLEAQLAAAKVELGRHLCYTSRSAQDRFWRQVEERADANS